MPFFERIWMEKKMKEKKLKNNKSKRRLAFLNLRNSSENFGGNKN